MLRPNVHYIRKSSNLNDESIRTLLILEERYIRGKINKKLIEEITNIYRKFIDYCTLVKEPLRLYFQEKLEYLYLDKKVIQIIIEEENKGTSQEEIKMLNNEFLNFSEIEMSDIDAQPEDQFLTTTNINLIGGVWGI